MDSLKPRKTIPSQIYETWIIILINSLRFYYVIFLHFLLCLKLCSFNLLIVKKYGNG